jgi:hypothetical protein
VPVTWRNLVSRLRELGFEGPFSGGKHSFMTKGDLVLTIPNPHKGKISRPVAKNTQTGSHIKRRVACE